MIKLSKRLELIASFIKETDNVCDIGCDHAHLPIYLCEKYNHIKVLATDINENPLEIAKDNIRQYKLNKRIELIQMDGIKELPDYIDTLILAGMGGILITDILNNKEKLSNIKKIVLAPNNEFEKVRTHLNKINYKIIHEELITENKITYLVIIAIPGKQKLNSFFGTLKNNNLEVLYYYTKLLNTNTNILKKMPKKYLIKRLKLKLQNNKIKKFLEKK